MSLLSSERIRGNATREMSVIFWFHIRIMISLRCLQMYVPLSILSLMISFASFCNALCLAERFWDIHLRTLIYWPPMCQCCFLVSRLLLTTVAIVMSVFWARITWDLVFINVAASAAFNV